MASHMPWWEPGTASGSHLLTYGHLIGERVHLLTGLPLRDFAHHHIARPIGADFQIGLRDADAERVADVIAPTLDFDPEALDQPHRILGRLGRLDGNQRPGAPHDDQLRHEQHGGSHILGSQRAAACTTAIYRALDVNRLA
jgi:hypothetical protein